MGWLWIPAIVLAVFLLLCLLRVGVLVTFRESTAVDLLIGPLRFRIVPARPGKKRAERKDKKEPDGKERPEKGRTFPRPELTDLRSAWRELRLPVKRALRRTRRGIRIAPLELSAVLAGRDDPAGAAAEYGWACGAVWTILPALEQLVRIPEPSIHLGVDFDSGQFRLQGRAGVSARIGTLLMLAAGTGIPALRCLTRYYRRHAAGEKPKKAENRTNGEAAPEKASAA